MNLNANPSKRELADLLAACDDSSASHVLWVGRDGAVHVTSLPPNMAPIEFGERHDLRFRYETFHAGNDYTGPRAAADDNFVSRLFKALVRDWQEGLTGYSDDWDVR